MTLSQEDGQLFYRLWLPLLDYVNERYHVCKDLKDMATAKGLDPADVRGKVILQPHRGCGHFLGPLKSWRCESFSVNT